MTTVFLLQNQDRLLLSKQGEWVDGREAGCLFRAQHRDEAVNQMVEVNARDYNLRIQLLECKLSERGFPVIGAGDMPLPLPEVAAEAAANDGISEAQAPPTQADAQGQLASA